MPFNQLILPLLGGYLLVTYTNCAVYWSSRQSKEQLLFASAFVGAILLILARAIALIVSNLQWGMSAYLFVHRYVPYDGIGTAVLALALSISFRWWINLSWSMSQAGYWLYGKDSLNQMESLLYMSFSGLAPASDAVFRSLPIELFRRAWASIPYLGRSVLKKLDEREKWRVISKYDDSTGKASPVPLLISMKDRKVYVGMLEKAPPLTAAGMTYVNIVVILSGYRDKDDLHVTFTDDYTAVFTSEAGQQLALPSCKVLPLADISNASLFDVDLFARFQEQRSNGEPSEGAEEESK